MGAGVDPAREGALVRCERLVVGFGRRALLPPFDLDIRPGEVLLVVGHNGAGKTTLARTLLGLMRPPRARCAGARACAARTCRRRRRSIRWCRCR